MVDERPSRVGEVIHNYRLVRELGRGGVGVVYEVEHVILGRKRAMKLLHGDVTAEVVARFFNEARAVNATKHPNNIDIEDFVTTETGENYLVMELLPGEDLRATLKREGKLDFKRTARIGRDLASALAAVHGVGIIHRDLKPENIFLVRRDGKETAKLLDFGVAKFINEQQGLTRTDMTIGTPSYMAPEQILTNHQVGPGSDLYSLGMVLYECLTGASAFAGMPRAQVLRAHCLTTPASPSERRGEPIPEVLESIVLKCLAKAPPDRFAHASELVTAFDADRPFDTQPSRRITAIELAEEVHKPRWRQLWKLAPVIAIFGIAVAIVGWPRSSRPIQEARPAAPAPRSAPPPPPIVTTPKTVDLPLVSTPPGASMFAGDRSIGAAPVTYSVEIGTTPISIVARWDDGREIVQTLLPDHARTLEFVAPVKAKKQAPKATVKRPPKTVNRDATVDPFKR